MAGQDDTNESDVKASSAWGQLFVGSILAGFAVWKLLLKVTNSKVSEVLRGLSATYDEVRDFLMLPFELIDLDLTASERDVLLVCGLLVATCLRVAFKYPEVIGLAVLALLFVAIRAPGAGANTLLPEGVRPWIGMTGLVIVVCFCLIPLALSTVFRRGGDEFLPMLTFFSFNIIFTVAWGVLLLLLNSATS